jgi:hypothetical protein
MVNLEWAICPVCNRRYGYVVCFKPATCGKRSCVESRQGQRLINGSTKVKHDTGSIQCGEKL